MKRILVIDESEVVRETLALILGREFSVVKRPLPGRGERAFADARDDVDLLILGVTPHLGTQVAALLHLAAQLPFAVLFLVESKSIASSLEREAEVGCLTKPFNPYELYRKVGELLARRGSFPFTDRGSLYLETGYLGFPFLSRTAASLVHRFAAARLPLLLSGEVGCGQERVASALCAQERLPSLRFSVDAAQMTEEYAAQLRFQISMHDELLSVPMVLLIQNIDRSTPAAQARLLSFVEDLEGKRENIWPITTASGNLLEQVYRGDFLGPLYYRLAALTLRLPALRERRDDIPALADWFARTYTRKLNLRSAALSEEALEVLRNYLWFGNVAELEVVIARTLAYHRKPLVAAEDLIFDFGSDPAPLSDAELAEEVESAQPEGKKVSEPRFEVYGGARTATGLMNGHGKTVDLNVVIHELAHELKNPMVTIKTFAQLLGERYQDDDFRNRFQEVVGGDIERMDDLLEMMIEFADFTRPRFTLVSLAEKVRAILARLQGECAKREARFEWKGNGSAADVRMDEAQLEYILKNLLLVILSETRKNSEIEIDLSRKGTLALSYWREGERMASISHYLTEQKPDGGETIFPLRILLAKHLLERNGGRFMSEARPAERERLTLEFATAEHRNED